MSRGTIARPSFYTQGATAGATPEELSIIEQNAMVFGLNDLGAVNGATAVSFAENHNAKLELDGAATLTFTAPVTATARLALHVIQDATGGRAVSWPPLQGSVPVIDLAPNAQTVVSLWFDGAQYHVE